MRRLASAIRRGHKPDRLFWASQTSRQKPRGRRPPRRVRAGRSVRRPRRRAGRWFAVLAVGSCRAAGGGAGRWPGWIGTPRRLAGAPAGKDLPRPGGTRTARAGHWQAHGTRSCHGSNPRMSSLAACRRRQRRRPGRRVAVARRRRRERRRLWQFRSTGRCSRFTMRRLRRTGSARRR